MSSLLPKFYESIESPHTETIFLFKVILALSVIKMSVMWDFSRRPPGSVGSAKRWGGGGLLVAQVSCKRLYLIHNYIADVFVGKVIVLHHFAHIRWVLAG